MFDRQWDYFLEQQAREFRLTKTQTSVFLTRFAHQNRLKKIEDVWQLADVASYEAFVSHSSAVYRAFKSRSDGCVELIGPRGPGSFDKLRNWLIEKFPESDDPYKPEPDTDSYLIQLPCESECYQTILEPGALIRIKAPSKMGKSILMNNILTCAGQQEYRLVHINLLQIERSKFDSLDKFLRWFCVYITDALELELDLNDYWSEDRGSMLSCTRYLEVILQQSEQPLVLGLDEVDRLLNYPDISQDFFYLLRSWHEEANNEELWEQLRMVVVYSTEDFGSLDINQSPFNVGLPIELKSFTQQQVKDLAGLYKLNFRQKEIDKLMETIGGHPYLLSLVMSSLANNPQLSLTKILQQGATDTGIFNSYLRQHLINLKANNKLSQTFREILRSSQAIQVDTLLAYQLYRMGLIKWSLLNNTVMPSCKLYKLYFTSRLGNNL